MKNLTLFTLLILTVSLFSCKSSKPETDYEAMAKELCNCMSPLVDMNEKIQELTKAGDTEAVGSMFSDLEAKFAEGERCAAALETKYGALNEPGEEAKAKAAIEKNCPKVAEMMNQADILE